ncbi:MAG: prepilin-type N-terminal cleavage/methylation domain-containing protein, partial [Bdellovibrionaceae bacterium]|nr:prepilin-type N-terminal cleavage/methylation domain-containing protein [Pseudobdellovibrionaceae bacterium]
MFKETDGRRNPRLATDHLLRDSRAGFSLVEVVVTVALLAIFVTGSLSFSGWVTDSVKTESSKADRNVESIEMLKLLTQPVYFGALSKFDTNSQLAKCMTLDQVFCDSRNEYPVTAYDLKTNSVLAKTSTSLTGGIASKISFKVHCANSQVSCDKADFYTVKIITSIVAPGGSVRDPIVKQGIVAPEFSNVATFV